MSASSGKPGSPRPTRPWPRRRRSWARPVPVRTTRPSGKPPWGRRDGSTQRPWSPRLGPARHATWQHPGGHRRRAGRPRAPRPAPRHPLGRGRRWRRFGDRCRLRGHLPLGWARSRRGRRGRSRCPITRRPEAVARALVAALDHWIDVRRRRHSQGWAKLVAAIRAARPRSRPRCPPHWNAIDNRAARLAHLKAWHGVPCQVLGTGGPGAARQRAGRPG